VHLARRSKPGGSRSGCLGTSSSRTGEAVRRRSRGGCPARSRRRAPMLVSQPGSRICSRGDHVGRPDSDGVVIDL